MRLNLLYDFSRSIIGEGKAIKITSAMVKCAKTIYKDLVKAIKLNKVPADLSEPFNTYSISNPYHQRLPNLDVALEHYKDQASFRAHEYTIGNVVFDVYIERLSDDDKFDGAARIVNPFYGKIKLGVALPLDKSLIRLILHEMIHLIDPKTYPKLFAKNYARSGRDKRARFEYLRSPVEVEAEMPIIARDIVNRAYKFAVDDDMDNPIKATFKFIANGGDYDYFTPKASKERLRAILSDGRYKRKFMNTLFYYLKRLEKSVRAKTNEKE